LIPYNSFSILIVMVGVFETVMRGLLLKNLLRLKVFTKSHIGECSLEGINTSFLHLLSGREHPLYNEAHSLFQKAQKGELKEFVDFYEQAAEVIKKELKEASEENRGF